MNTRALKIYFAGDLFNAKDLGGNLMLATAINEVSQGRYQAMLPQDGECETVQREARRIRNSDFDLLFHCDLILANFDGTDLDSGTVVEFCFSKMLDMPAVLLRTDFRHAGDQELQDGDPWNLMCSHYPRTEVLAVNAMLRYQQFVTPDKDPLSQLQNYYLSVARDIVCSLDKVISQPTWLDRSQLLFQYQQTVKSIGGNLSSTLTDDILQKIVEDKIAAQIY